MLQVRLSSFIIFHLLKDAGYVQVVDSEEVVRFAVEDHLNIYETLREVLNHIDSMDENVTVRATISTENKLFQQAYLIGRSDLEPDEEVIDCVESEWQANIDKEYESSSEAKCLRTFMTYMMEADCKDDLWSCWDDGEFSSIYHEWPDCPLEAFLFADSELFCRVTD